VHKADNLPPSCAVVTKSGNLNFLEPSGSVQACNGTALPITLPETNDRSATNSPSYNRSQYSFRSYDIIRHLNLFSDDLRTCCHIYIYIYIYILLFYDKREDRHFKHQLVVIIF